MTSNSASTVPRRSRPEKAGGSKLLALTFPLLLLGWDDVLDESESATIGGKSFQSIDGCRRVAAEEGDGRERLLIEVVFPDVGSS